LVAGVTSFGIKLAAGRVRPDSSATVLDTYDPFSRHRSFPSGHAALSFAAARALDRETEAGWVPWVAYPLAGLCAWSRVRDDRHWTSDVVAGAALGTWLAGKTEDALRARAGRSTRVGVRMESSGETMRLAARLTF
ncbi:MAG TPA: phosphatase PAP2 family protein, partial [Candidatus Eisenbacteria bacterium]|nr:phosphatase PAP2 family protein [Candidatus Eisenbacteria bacterium]